MKTKRLIILGILAVLVIAYVIAVVPNFRRHAERKKTVAALQSLPRDRVETAVRAFIRDRKASVTAQSATVPLRDLLSGGYLRIEEVRGLEDRDVTVSLSAAETTPQMIWIRVHPTVGNDICLMVDGSVQALPRQ